MLKPFATFPNTVHSRSAGKGVFIIDDSWKAEAVELVGVPSSKKRRFNGNVWVGTELKPPSEPGTKVMYIIHMQVGRNRSHRYVVSDGKVWADVYSVKPKRNSGKRGWYRFSGPWKMIELVQARPLTTSAQLVINAAINSFMAVETKAVEVNLID